jgi:hypothetical protein
MSSKPSRDWTKPVIGVLATVALISGCSAGRVETPTLGPTATPTSTPTMPPTEPPPGPVKYTTSELKSCPEIRQQVGGDLPSAQPDDNQKPGSNSSSRTCTFKTAEQSVVFSVRSWENTDDATGVESGAEHAKKWFTERTESWEQDTGVKIGSDARWRTKSSAACALEVLDENAVLTVLRSSNTALNDEQCRGSVRDLAKKFYAAVQP